MGLFQVETKSGALRGVQKVGYCVYRGVPYAKPPVGELRWKRPEPVVPWKGLREAKVFANRPIEESYEDGSFYQKEFCVDEDFLPPKSEDCLYLNIWTPAETAQERLPVAFWIHGGGFVNGFASESEFDGAAFAAQGVILVTIGYRLGALGLLAHPWFSAEGNGISGNYGLYDLILGLDWVRENIAAFGGNADCITVFGQSAGSMATQTLISSKLTKGKIHRAILQSASGYKTGISRFKPLADLEKAGVNFAEFCGAGSLKEFRAIPAEKMQALQIDFISRIRSTEPGARLPFGPCIDNNLLEGASDELLEQGVHPDIPYMLGCTAADLGFSPAKAAAGEHPALYDACVRFSALNQQLGRKAAYVYFFTQRPLGDDAGAFHSSELWYEFGTLNRSWRPKSEKDYILSRRVVSFWSNFIKTGDPNGPGLPEWKPCKTGDPQVIELCE